MGLFSRREKAPKAIGDTQKSLSTRQSKSSLTSGSSIKSPGTNSRIMNRSSAGTTGSNGPGTPLTPFSPSHNPSIPKIDLPKPPDPELDPAGYLRSLGAVRERSKIITDKALRNDLRHFDVDMRKFSDVVTFVANIIKVCRAADSHLGRDSACAGRVWSQPRSVCSKTLRHHIPMFHNNFANVAFLARLRRPFHEHSAPWTTPAFCGRWTRQNRATPDNIPRKCG
jgi:hypothetical protein